MRKKKSQIYIMSRAAGLTLSVVLAASSVPAGTALAAEAGTTEAMEQTFALAGEDAAKIEAASEETGIERLETMPEENAGTEQGIAQSTESVTDETEWEAGESAGAVPDETRKGTGEAAGTVTGVTGSGTEFAVGSEAAGEDALQIDGEYQSEQTVLAAASSAQVVVSTEEELIEAVNNSSTDASERTKIVLSQDIAVTKKLVIPTGHFVEITGDKSGRRLSTKNKFSDSQLNPAGVILVNGDLVLNTIEINGSGLTRAIAVYDGSLVLNDGAVITGGKITSHMDGGGLYIADNSRTENQASLTINEGAKICNNVFSPSASVEATGIGLYIEQAKVVMNGGEISGNQDISTPSMRSRAAAGGAVGISGTTGSFTMNGGTIENNLVKGNGGAFRADNSSKIIINDGTIRNNMCYGNGGAFYMTTSGAGGSSLQIKGGTISGNVADATNSAPDTDRSLIGSGGAVFLENETTMEMSGGTIEGNSAIALPAADTNGLDGGQGGAVYVTGTLTMTGGTITGNTAKAAKTDGYKTGNGGGIAVSGGSTPGTVHIKGGTIQKNTATLKGADIYINADKRTANLMSVGSSLLTTEAQGTLKIEGKPVIGNLYLSSDTNFYLTGGITQAQIRVETETKENGCVIARGDNYRIMADDARILTNVEGKKIYNLENEVILLTGERTYTNLSKAKIDEISDQIFTGTEIMPEPDVTLDGKKLILGTDYQLSYSDNINAGEAVLSVTGAGMYSGSVKKTFTIRPKNLDTVSVGRLYEYLFYGEPVIPDLSLTDNGIRLEKDQDYSVVFRNNGRIGTAEAVVSGIGNYTGTKVLQYAIISSEGSTVCTDEKSLTAAVAAAAGTAVHPDVIFVSGDIELTATLHIPKGKYINLIGVDENAVLTGSVFSADQNEEDILIPGTEGISKTSMIRVEGNLMVARLRMRPKAYSKARPVMERVLRVDQGGTLTLNDGSVVSGGYGYVGSGLLNLGNVEINGAFFSDNRLTAMTNGLGGAIVNDKTGTLTITGGTFSGNLSRKGGAIYNAEGAKAYISGGTFRKNTASFDQGSSVVLTGEGGAVYNDSDSYLEISGGSLLGNTADDYGGGIANYGTLKITDVDIAENEAGKNGAGIYTSGTAVFDDGVIRDNRIQNNALSFETADGGGVFVAKGTFTMNGGVISNNKVKNTYNSLTSFSNAGNGGGVYVSNHEDGSSFIMHGGIISGNEAVSYLKEPVMGHGGGVYIAGGSGKAADRKCKPGTFFMDGGTITANTASGAGDGIYASAECTFSYEENRNEYVGTIKGAPSLSIAKGAVVEKNASDNLYLTEGIIINVTDALAGKLVLTAQQGADVLILKGSGYQLTQEDAECVTNENGNREVVLDASGNAIYLRAVHIENAYKIATTEKIFIYTGENIRPAVTVTEKNNADHVLKEGTDYTIAYTDENGSERTADATDKDGKPYVITVTGCGEYAGTLTKTYTVQPASVSLTETNIPDQTYTGKAISYIPNLGDITYLGQALSRNKDFYIVAGSYRQNTEVGTASFQIIGNRDYNGKGSGNYTGTRTVRFNIVADKTVTGWMKDTTGWYWIDANGNKAKSQWIKSSGEWYYLKADGYMAANEWVKGSKGWCWLGANGACARDCWAKIGGNWYHFDKDGWMQTGWLKVSGKWYYLSGSGAMVTGWQQVSGKWYYLSGSGAMVTGWQQVSGKWYYLSSSGAMVTGWQKIGSYWYYFDGSGVMAAGKWIGNYYLTSSGAMATDKWIGKYYVGADGKWIPNYK